MKSLTITEDLYDYILAVSSRESVIQRRLRNETARLPMAIMQISPDQGQFMALLVELMGVTKAIEIGVFMSRLSCPVCSGSSTENLLSLDCGNLGRTASAPAR